MRNGRAKVQMVSIGPALNQQAERLQLLKKDRHVTIAGPYRDAAHTPDRISRVEKVSGNHRRRRRSVSPKLIRQLDKAFDSKREELGNWAEANLGDEQTRVNEELTGLEDHFTSRLKLMQDLEDLVDAPFGNQTSGVFRQEDDKTGEWEEVEVVIQDRLEDYSNVIEQEEEKLKDLSQQWDSSQVEMTCLAVEVLGLSSAEVQESEALENAFKHIDKAGVLHKNNGERYVEAGNNIAVLKAELTALYNNTTKSTKAQQNSWRTERKKILENVKKAFGDFEKIR